MRKPDSGFGNGTIGNVQWPYFQTQCMQRRQMAVAHQVLKQGCKHIVEIGGYLTPLDGFLRNIVGDSGQKLPGSYINIDPSVNAAMDVTANEMRSVHIPMTLADFTSSSSSNFRKKFELTEFASSTDDT